ncbi:SVM family protein [Candidatus Phytoplasma prunorum]|uniref:SVM family protein n=1 Tax=Candidatus Phytoplasma prunorum TaxID=47565 RepID=UPI002FF020FA
MVNLKKHLSLFKIVIFICLGLFLIINNNHIMATSKNKQISNEKEMSDDENYHYFLKEQIIIQQELSNYLLKDTEKKDLMIKYNYLNKKIKNYEKKINNSLNKPESSNSKKK